MIVAIASGKGGTGKTSISVNLASVLEGPVQLIDCDVEEPNIHLFLPGRSLAKDVVNIDMPQIDATRCDGCGMCVEACQFNALALVAEVPMLFGELCHGCGCCALVCPQLAIGEKASRIGVIKTWQSGQILLKGGCLDVGVSSASTLVHAVKERLVPGMDAILDAPPGTACQAVATLRGVDYAVLVTEPTPFGLHDLRLAVDTARELGVKFGVVINRSDIGDARVHDYCTQENIPVLLEIPEDRRIAEAYSRGELMIDALPQYRADFQRLWQAIARQEIGA